MQAEGKCPGCEADELHMHFATCQNKKMIKARQGALRALSAGLRAINTYSGCISVITKGLTTTFESAMKSMGIPSSYKDALLQEAAWKQHELGHHAMHKGLIVKIWDEVQKEWCREIGARYDLVKWSRKVVLLLHNYSKTLWTTRNQLLHGEDASEAIEIRKARCKERIRTLYKYSRKCLSRDEKKLFNLPLQYRQKGSIAGMTLWIDRVEMIFQHNLHNTEDQKGKTIMWWFPKSQKWKKQVPSEPG